MQVIAPDFFAPFGGKPAAREEERPGDGQFDALLREEEARHTREPQTTREPHDAARPPRDARLDETHHEDAWEDTPPDATERAEEPVERRDPATEDPAEESVAETRSDADDRSPDDFGNGEVATPLADAGKPQNAATTAKETAGDHTAKPAADAVAQAAGKAGAAGFIVPGVTAPQNGATANTGGQAAQPGAATAATPAAGKAQQAAAQPGGGAAAATPETNAQPASGAASAQRAGNKAKTTTSPTAQQAGQVAASQRQSPGVTPTGNGSRPANDPRREAQPGSQAAVVVTATASVESRPAAALGGAAATAALAQGADAPAKTAAAGTKDNAPTELRTGQAAQPAAKASAQNAQPAKAPEALAATGGKAPAADRAAAPAGSGDAVQAAAHSTVATAAPTGGSPTSGPLHHAGFSEALASAHRGQAANPAEQIAVQVQRAQVDGHDKISIKLHPAELGRIDVKLESSHDGTLRAVISAERSDTLDLLQRDARGLERALQDAGVKTDSGSLSFNLRGQHQGQNPGHQAGGSDGFGRSLPDGRPGGVEDTDILAAQAQPYRSSHSGALDIRV